MEDQIFSFLSVFTSIKWRYQSNGAWNNKILSFSANNTVQIANKTVGYWGADGIALWFRVQDNSVTDESLVATYISDERVDWLKINSGEKVHMLANFD